MLLDLLFTGDIQGAIISFLLSVPIIILVLSVHEYAHGLVAKKLGDPTAESLGRLTLNPLNHIDPIGFLMFISIAASFVFMLLFYPQRTKKSTFLLLCRVFQYLPRYSTHSAVCFYSVNALYYLHRLLGCASKNAVLDNGGNCGVFQRCGIYKAL